MKSNIILFSTLALLLPSVLGNGLLTRPCYCTDSCDTLEWDEDLNWSNGNCFNFGSGASAFGTNDANIYCQVYNDWNCQGASLNTGDQQSQIPGDNFYFCESSTIGWLYSAICWD